MQALPEALAGLDVATCCERHGIARLAVFGSVLRGDLGPESDVDFLVRLDRRRGPSIYDLVRIRRELEALFGRRVDVVEEDGLRNPFRRHHIMRTRRILYDAGSVVAHAQRDG